ncbi:MAG: endonuclease/exonuclease/phosphatase family protein [Chloroflexota bacterium]|nr:endonuclease/exonuclease/phosphatase family protein [Chloroflexota bacterium]MDE2894224.1 endonuclease/exonuclease/phosphatase family protein [Chloroflexota bacterium]
MTILVLAIAVVQGLQLLRGLLASLSVYLGQIRDVDSATLAGVIVLIFLSGFAAPVVRRVVGGRYCLAFLAVALALIRLAEQLAPTPDARLATEIAGVVVWLWLLQFVASMSLPSASGSDRGRAVVVILVGLTIDTAIIGAFATLDPGFSRALAPLLFTIALVGGQLALIAWLARNRNAPDSSGELPAWSCCIGPALALEILLFQNLARHVVLVGWELPATFTWLLTANLFAVWIAAFCSVRDSTPPRWAMLAASAILVVCVVQPEHRVWAGFAAAAGPVAIGVLLAGALASRLSRGWGWFSAAAGLLAIPLVLFGWYAPYQIDVPAPQITFPMIAVALLVVSGWRGRTGSAARSTESGRETPSIRRSWRRAAVVPGVASVLLLLPLVLFVAERSPGAPPSDDDPLTMATYNIHQGFDLQGMPSLERILDVIEEERPHVVALQEVPRGWAVNGSVDALSWLAQRLQMHWAWGPAADPFWGNAVLSRYPIVDLKNRPMPNNDVLNLDRGYLLVTIDVNGELVQIVATHLHHVEWEPQHRIPQVQELLDGVDWSRPSVLLGDLNAQPHHAEILMLAKAGLSPGRPAVPTFPADRPRRQIDYILATTAFTVVELRTVDTDASDHLPLFATLIR